MSVENSIGSVPYCAPGFAAPCLAPRPYKRSPLTSMPSAHSTVSGPGAPALGSCRSVTRPYVNYEEAPGSPSLLQLLSSHVSPQLPATEYAGALHHSWLASAFGAGRGEAGPPVGAGDAAASAARDFFLHLALNHSVMPEVVDGVADLCASSPDELAFVSASEYFGLEFVGRDAAKGLVTLAEKQSGRKHVVELLDVFPYESSRKRMSVVVRLPPELLPHGSSCREVIFTKGADSVLLETLNPDHDAAVLSHAAATLQVRAPRWQHLPPVLPRIARPRPQSRQTPSRCRCQEWSEMALRTLVFCRRELPNFAAWRSRFLCLLSDPACEPARIAGNAHSAASGSAELNMLSPGRQRVLVRGRPAQIRCGKARSGRAARLPCGRAVHDHGVASRA